jgi:hypothetical protein
MPRGTRQRWNTSFVVDEKLGQWGGRGNLTKPELGATTKEHRTSRGVTAG